MSDAGRELTVTTPTDREIELTRAFDAPADLVFDALTRPELLRRWFGARGWQLVDCRIDLRVGGAWRFVSRGPGDEEMAHGGTYQVIEPARRLVYTERYDEQSYPGDTLIDHRFVERAGVTTLTSTIRYATPEGRDRVLRYPMRRGVSEGYRRLDDLLAERIEADQQDHGARRSSER